MTRTFTQSVNLCGRRIAYPKFSAMDVFKPKDVAPPPVTLTPGPGTDVEDGKCTSYYDSKTLADASDECKSCWQQALDSDTECSCNYEGDACKFARCVHTEYNKPVSRCANAYAALFNLDDVADDKFKPPFTLSDIKDCSAVESYAENGKGIPDWLKKLLPLVLIGTILYILYKLLKMGRETSSRQGYYFQ